MRCLIAAAVASAIFIILCLTSAYPDTITIPQIKKQLQVLYGQAAAYEEKAEQNGGYLNYTDRAHYLDILRRIDALEELLEMYTGERFSAWLMTGQNRLLATITGRTAAASVRL